jgi:hypothetical protein
MKNWKQKTVIGIFAIIALAFAVVACEDEDDPPKPHESTITAFSKTATVAGDASIPAADFQAAVGKLQTILSEMDSAITGLEARAKYTNMLSRPIIIVSGNVGPGVSTDKSMTIGTTYLSTTDDNTIKGAINTKVVTENAFAE